MTSFEQQLAVAQFLDTHTVERIDLAWGSGEPEPCVVVHDFCGGTWCVWPGREIMDVGFIRLPSCLDRLDVVQRMEEKLTPEQKLQRVRELYALLGLDVLATSVEVAAAMLDATPAQRTEAILRTLGLWKES